MCCTSFLGKLILAGCYLVTRTVKVISKDLEHGLKSMVLALSPDNWPIPTKGSKKGYSCVRTMVVARKKNQYFQRGLTLVRPISRKSLKLHVNSRFNACCLPIKAM